MINMIVSKMLVEDYQFLLEYTQLTVALAVFCHVTLILLTSSLGGNEYIG
jgi:hypothetical protein